MNQRFLFSLVIVAWLAATPWAMAQSSNYANAVLSDNPVAYYRLDETALSTAADASSVAGSQNGTYVNFGTGVGSGNIGQAGPRHTDLVNGMPLLGFEASNFAPHFNGSDTRVVVADTGAGGALDITGSLTLEAWVNPDTLGTGNNGIVSKYIGSGDQRAYQFFVNSQANQSGIGALGLSLSEDGTFGAAEQIIDSDPLGVGEWQHVVATYVPDTSMRLWVNGQLVEELTTTDVPDFLFDSTAPFAIGATFSLTDTANFFDGLIDEVAIYDFALDDLDEDGVIDLDNLVQAHFDAAFTAVPEPTSAAMWLLLGAAIFGGAWWRRRRTGN